MVELPTPEQPSNEETCTGSKSMDFRMALAIGRLMMRVIPFILVPLILFMARSIWNAEHLVQDNAVAIEALTHRVELLDRRQQYVLQALTLILKKIPSTSIPNFEPDTSCLPPHVPPRWILPGEHKDIVFLSPWPDATRLIPNGR
jgi:hypothetical protein